MAGSLTEIVLRDDEDQNMGYVRYSQRLGWRWVCAVDLCIVGSAPGSGAPAPEAAVGHLVDHIGRAHP
jgi:hypothetical protein